MGTRQANRFAPHRAPHTSSISGALAAPPRVNAHGEKCEHALSSLAPPHPGDVRAFANASVSLRTALSIVKSEGSATGHAHRREQIIQLEGLVEEQGHQKQRLRDLRRQRLKQERAADDSESGAEAHAGMEVSAAALQHGTPPHTNLQ